MNNLFLKNVFKLMGLMVLIFLAGYFIEEAIDLSENWIPESYEETIEVISELFSVFVAFSIFAITWHSYEKSGDNRSLFLGMAFYIVGLLILFHLLSYPFMPVFFTPNSEHKAAIFLIESRVILGVFLLASVYIHKDSLPRLINKHLMILFMFVISMIIFATAILFNDDSLKVIDIDGYSSSTIFFLVITTIPLLYAGYKYYQKSRETDNENNLKLAYGSIIIILSNLVYFSYEFSGHFLIITGFFFIYLALYKSSVELPYEKLAMAEEKLRITAEDKYRLLFDNANDAIITTDLEDMVTSWNRSAENIFGWTASEAMGKKLKHVIVPVEQHKKSEEIIRETLESKSAVGIDMVHLHKDGRKINVSLTTSMLIGPNKNITGLSYILRDITERKHMEGALSQSEEKYRTLYEGSADAIMMLDEKGFFDCNMAALYMFGYLEKKDFIKLHPSDFSPPTQPDGVDSLTAANNKIAEAFSKGSNMFEWVHRRSNGKDFPANVLLSTVQLKGKTVLQATVRDITESKKAEEERRMAEEIRLENERLVMASKTKAEFLAIMSHELRTPLNAIIGFSELMIGNMQVELNEKQKRYMENIHSSGKTLLSLVDGILDLSRIEAGKMEVFIEKMSVHEAINDTISPLNEKAVKQNIILKNDLDPQLDTIETDTQKFKHILTNLVSNAIKFSKPDGGTVTIRTKKEGKMAKFSVSDTGIGIMEKDFKRLFKTFEQLDTGSTRKYGGTGLGLVVSKNLVELLGGSISVESRYGEGSTFTFTLPVDTKHI